MDQLVSYSTKGIFFNTLGQIGTTKKTKPIMKVQGKGSDLTDTEALKGRAKRKLTTHKSVLPQIDIAMEKRDFIMVDSLWRTYHCQTRLVSSGTKYYGEYCKNRFCTLCCSIRKAEIINKYLPIIMTWENPCFVTLTVLAYPKIDLRALIRACCLS